VLAARLCADAAARVLLLEAGSAERTPAMTVPNAWPQNVGSAADWGYVTTEQAEAGQVPYPRGQVRGVAGLRVADASVMPVIPNAHPNATVLAIAERAADLIAG
jgi:choline dehydrogenase-like flavoprotein